MKQPSLEQRIEAVEIVIKKLCFYTGDVGLLHRTLVKTVERDAINESLDRDHTE